MCGRYASFLPPEFIARLFGMTGYCDQSHMIREFREFAELTPDEYIARSLPAGDGLIEE